MNSATFGNPITFSNLQELLLAILNVVMIMLIPVVVFFIIYAGFLYVTARGNSQQIEQATRALLYGVIGGVIIIGSFAITEIIANTVAGF